MMIVKYRPDIDGLRTVAIVPVLLFHAGVPGMPGGFVGVDVFFVISGYLITAIIARELDNGTFSIVRFYERRIRRIFPALAVMMAAVLAGAAWLYFPADYRLVPRSVVAALLFVSNVFFWSETGYFDTAAHSKPMLHTWSLAVEEQFYIVFPLLLIFLRRSGASKRNAALTAIFIASLLLSIVLTRNLPDFAFFMLPTRAWELLAGSLLALGVLPPIANRAAREALAVAGLAAIAWAVLTFSATTPFPGISAMYPVLGAAALLHVAPGTAVGKLLSIRLVVFIGLISYSLYLWHWPVIVFVEYATDQRLEGVGSLAAICLSLLLALLSWRFVERPFRDVQQVPRRRIFVLAGSSASLILGISVAAIAARGWPQRFAPAIVAYAGASRDVSPRREECHRQQDGWRGVPPCVFGAAVPPTAMMWGDSHGVELSQALGEAAVGKNRAFVSETTSSCQPLIGFASPGSRCEARNRAVLSYLDARPGIRTVIIVGFWANPANLTQPAFASALEATVMRLRQRRRRVILVGAIPMHDWPVPRHVAHLAQQRALGAHEAAPPSEAVPMINRMAPILARLRADGVTVVDPRDQLCRGDYCDFYRGGQVLYFDRHHLSMAGARIVATSIGDAMLD